MGQKSDQHARLLGDVIVHTLRSHPWAGEPSFRHIQGSRPAQIVMKTGWWTSSLSWKDDAVILLDVTTARSLQPANHPATAAALTKPLIDVQERRHRTATAHGLASEAGAALDPALIAVDHVPAQLLATMHIDPVDLITTHQRHAARGARWGGPSINRDALEIGLQIGSIIVTFADGGRTPVLTCWLPLSGAGARAHINGNVLWVAARIPETLVDAAIGRRLGDVVATGIPMLDQRLITGAASTFDGVDFTFEADLTTIGEAASGS